MIKVLLKYGSRNYSVNHFLLQTPIFYDLDLSIHSCYYYYYLINKILNRTISQMPKFIFNNSLDISSHSLCLLGCLYDQFNIYNASSLHTLIIYSVIALTHCTYKMLLFNSNKKNFKVIFFHFDIMQKHYHFFLYYNNKPNSYCYFIIV